MFESPDKPLSVGRMAIRNKGTVIGFRYFPKFTYHLFLIQYERVHEKTLKAEFERF